MENLTKQNKIGDLGAMVNSIDNRFSLEEEIKNAILSIDRKEFVPQIFKHLSYQIDALPMDNEQWISSPLTVAKMTQYLEPKGCDSVLEIGCGSGYQAAILSKLFRRVFTIERIDSLLQEARARFKRLDITNINSKFDDGTRGWAPFAPFDRILFSASPNEIPQVIFDQLAEGGILVAPIYIQGLQIIIRYYKKNGKITQDTLEPCKFVPVVKGKVF